MYSTKTSHRRILSGFKICILTLCMFSLETVYSIAYAQDEVSATPMMEGTHLGVAWGFAYGYGSSPAEKFLPQLHEMGIHLSKVYLFWQQIEPEKGKYDWKSVDALISQIGPEDETLISVWSASGWATQVSTDMLPPSAAKSLEDYYQFVYQLVKHCQGKVKYWQNDCEPNNPVYWSGSDEEFITQLKVFYRAVKDADPDASVVLGGYDGLFNPPGMWEYPGQARGLSFFNKVINEASDYFDVFDLRLYGDPYTIPYRVNYFKQKMEAVGSIKPMICTEYNGPGFYAFPENHEYIPVVMQWQEAISTRDTLAYEKIKQKMVNLYDSMGTLAPQTQMFMMDCSEELNDQYYRIQGRDMVMRNVLALAAGIEKTFYWDLWHDTEDTFNLMTMMYAKNKLMEYEQGALTKSYPQVAVMERMSTYLNTSQSIQKINTPGKESLYLFEILRKDQAPVMVAWEARDTFAGESQLPNAYQLSWSAEDAKVVDIFGHPIAAKVQDGKLSIALSSTPVFVETVETEATGSLIKK